MSTVLSALTLLLGHSDCPQLWTEKKTGNMVEIAYEIRSRRILKEGERSLWREDRDIIKGQAQAAHAPVVCTTATRAIVHLPQASFNSLSRD